MFAIEHSLSYSLEPDACMRNVVYFTRDAPAQFVFTDHRTSETGGACVNWTETRSWSDKLFVSRADWSRSH